uniref:Uncharacterized protein n=1 Tax=Caenorhabditis tropicalis TaxID=1561998 RepID=A0A1I7TCB2_9PELO
MSDPADEFPEAEAGGPVVGESIPTPLLTGMVAGAIFGILMVVCHICVTKYLVTQRLKHLPRARKVKVKKTKKDKKGKKSKKGKKGKKGKKESGTTGTTSGSGTTATGGTTM